MKNKFIVASCLSFLIILTCPSIKAQPIKLLIYSKTNGFHHKSIPAAIAALSKMASENNWQLTFTDDSLSFSSLKQLQSYNAIVFVLITGKIFDTLQENAFKQYLQQGGGLVTIHTGTDCEKNWPWYMNAIGAKFKNHPKQQQATYLVIDSTHSATKLLPKVWSHFDEIYNFAAPVSDSVHVLLTVDESSYTGGTMGVHPITWYRNLNKGRIFQTALGHTDACYTDTDFLAHLKGGIEWAATAPLIKKQTIKRKR
jgi:type 1 glutamine amidotransferase